MKIVITGATGFLGSYLTKKLHDEAHDIIVLTRVPDRAKEKLKLDISYEYWPFVSERTAFSIFKNVDVVIHLAGESLSEGLWTPQKKMRLYDSRIQGTRSLVKIIQNKNCDKPKLFLSASAIGYYGDCGELSLSEKAASGTGFLSRLCVDWEREAEQLQSSDVRVVSMRTGLVMGPGGGVLQKMLFVFKLRLGTVLGSGQQWLSWVHRDDVLNMIRFVMNNKTIKGPVNFVSPNPVRQKEFAVILGRIVNRKVLFSVPGKLLRVLIGEKADLLLSSQKVVPAVLQEQHYKFLFSDLSEALKQAIVWSR